MYAHLYGKTLEIHATCMGNGTVLFSYTVKGKKEAREIAARHAAQCWNF